MEDERIDVGEITFTKKSLRKKLPDLDKSSPVSVETFLVRCLKARIKDAFRFNMKANEYRYNHIIELSDKDNVLSNKEFVHFDFSGISLKLFVFQKCIFHSCRFSEVSLSSIKFTRCFFYNVDFRLTDFTDSSIDESQLIWTDMSHANISCSYLAKNRFFGSKFIGTDLSYSNMSNSELLFPRLHKTLLDGVNLTESIIHYPDMYKTSLVETDFSNSCLSLTEDNFGVDFSKCIFKDTRSKPEIKYLIANKQL